mmetsp:Transcript_19098/g.28270  ORF Transcript_19098/g.28270 Transcript_19098/m.28270 type:complete len:183 (+) Transcript_19098:420-968(+)
MMQRAQPSSCSTCMLVYGVRVLLRLGRFLPLRLSPSSLLALRTLHLSNVPPHLLSPSNSNAASSLDLIRTAHLLNGLLSTDSPLISVQRTSLDLCTAPLLNEHKRLAFEGTSFLRTASDLHKGPLSNAPLSTHLFGSTYNNSFERTSLLFGRFRPKHTSQVQSSSQTECRRGFHTSSSSIGD